MAPTEPVGGDLPAAYSERPRRQSLPEPELVSELEEATRDGSTTGAIDRLQEELELRASEARDYRAFEARMRQIGTPEAISALERVRDEFSDVVPGPATAGPPRRIVPDRRSNAQRLSGPNLVVFAPGVSAAAAPAPNVDESHEIVFDDPGAEAAESDARAERQAPTPEPVGPERGLGPLGATLRAGRSSRLFWLWFAGNASLLGVVVGGVLFSLGLSLRQSLVAMAVGLAVSAIPIAVGTLAVRVTGQPTMVVSRAVFGFRGNLLPASVMLLSRVFWGAVLLWILASTIARILVVSGLAESEAQVTVATLGVALLLAAALAALDHRVIARFQQVIAIVSTVLLLGFIALTVGRVDVRVALTVGDGPWVLVLAGAVVVFSVFGLLWANSASDLSRHQRAVTSGVARVSWATAGAVVPAGVLVSYGALLAASDPVTAVGLLRNPVDAIIALLPAWYPLPLVAAVGFGLLSSVSVTVYSAGYTLQALVPRLDRRLALGLVTIALAGTALAFAVTLVYFAPVVSDLATTVAVPVAAWTGVLGSTLLLRRHPIDGVSLLRRGRALPDFVAAPLVAFVLATAIGLGFTTASVEWLAWQGFLLPLVGAPSGGEFAVSDSGVFLALALGLLAPLLMVGATGRAGSPGTGAHRPAKDADTRA